MKKAPRLEWKRDPEGYLRKEQPGGLYLLVPASGRLEEYAHDFDKTKLVFVELINACTLRDLNDLVLFANKWGLPNVHGEAAAQEFFRLREQVIECHHAVKKRDQSTRDAVALAMPALPRSYERFAPDGSAVHQIPSTLSGFCQLEYVHAVTLDVPLGSCHNCGRLFVHRIRRGRRQDARTFCRNKCKHSFHNRRSQLLPLRTAVRLMRTRSFQHRRASTGSV